MDALPACLARVPADWAPVGPHWSHLAQAHLGSVAAAAGIGTRDGYVAAVDALLVAPMTALVRDFERRARTHAASAPPRMRLRLAPDDGSDDDGLVVPQYTATLESTAAAAAAARATVTWAAWRLAVGHERPILPAWLLEHTPGAGRVRDTIQRVLLAHDARALLRLRRHAGANADDVDLYPDARRRLIQTMDEVQYDRLAERHLGGGSAQEDDTYETVSIPVLPF